MTMFSAEMVVIATASAKHPDVKDMTEDEKKFLGITEDDKE